jgi:hypothetical protein
LRERGRSKQYQCEQTLDLVRHAGVSVYREVKQEFSVGDRIQFTAPNKQQDIANRELGTIEQLSEKKMRVRLCSG